MKGKAGVGGDGFPECYAITDAGMALRICERYGRDPFVWWDALSPGQQTLLMRQEAVRSREEANRQ